MIRTMVMVAALVLGVSVCLAQSQDRLRITALLRITSPADRTIVYAGETISVSVSADPSVTVVAVIGEDPIGATHEPTAGPVQFSLTIPPRTPVDKYHIRAFGRISAGRPVASEPITLFVENRLASGVRSLRVEPRLLRFEALGHFMPLRVVGTLPDVEGVSEGGAGAAREGRIRQFREDTRDARIKIAREAEHRYRRKVSWGARCGDQEELFTTASVPIMTRLRMPERQVLDTLVEAGVARSRSHALAWCVRLVGQNESEWIAKLKEALTSVQAARAEGPGATSSV